MASQTEIVCLCEGKHGGNDKGNDTSIDPIFINKLIRTLKPSWIKRRGSNFLRILPQRERSSLMKAVPEELRTCLGRGGQTTLMVWADIDDDKLDGEDLKRAFWEVAHKAGITREQFDQIVFVFAKDRLENWIEYLLAGSTDESKEGPRVKGKKAVALAAKQLAQRCLKESSGPPLPPSLEWSCKNWRALVKRMKST